ncbi:SagB/ThcOx family dehydrogenase [Cupriavidus basilensis]|uniref:SagB/ThcOx family dehydrogenase n=1 Tax=Cupriavidus basilensis TaxID=68895 RepID=A0ABT6AT27_9BURK|nr:SagB/ThcOx family dehydrogenase [Cupriavidus basilensis]MDF3835776.1 SagB/ThcOx family dehydrogenase [Cupriavidus basilensis]
MSRRQDRTQLRPGNFEIFLSPIFEDTCHYGVAAYSIAAIRSLSTTCRRFYEEDHSRNGENGKLDANCRTEEEVNSNQALAGGRLTQITSMKAHFNPNIFLIIKDSGIIVWDFEKHNQYLLASDYAHRLLKIAYTQSFDPRGDSIDMELQNENLVSNKPFVEPPWGWDILSRIFHLGTKDIPQDVNPKDGVEWATNYIRTCHETLQHKIPVFRQREFPVVIPLEKPSTSILENCTLWQALSSRRTCRQFRKETVSKEKFGSILYASFGFMKDREQEINEFVPDELRQRRSSPSGGGLNSSEIYIWCHQVESLDPGIYHYNPENHSLALVRTLKNMESLSSLLAGQYFSENLAFGAFIASRFDRMWWKYGHSRAYRVSLLDIGHLSQTFQLASSAVGLNTWLSAAFKDSEVEKILGIDTLDEQVLLFVGSGYSNGGDMDPISQTLLGKQQ